MKMKKVMKVFILMSCTAVLMFALTGCLEKLKTGKSFEASETEASDAQQETVSQAAAAVTQDAAAVTQDAAAVTQDAAAVTQDAAAVTQDAAAVTQDAAAVTQDAAAVTQTAAAEEVTSEVISFDPSWEYAANSKINSGSATLYHAKPTGARGIVVCINAGHGTQGGSSVKTLCHPDGTPKVTGGTTEAGATEAYAVSTGTTFQDGTPEAVVTLKLALVVKEKLLNAGFDVLMIRESEDVQLDNIARTLMANNKADCHIALHYDGTSTDKGVFFMSVPSQDSYRSMEPVASHYEEHNALGRAVVSSLELCGMKLYDGGAMEMDLTQTSYSTVPSIDLEVGDTVSDYSEQTLNVIADGIVLGVDTFFKGEPA